MMEECGEMEAGEARRWKEGIYGLMLLWGWSRMRYWQTFRSHGVTRSPTRVLLTCEDK